MCWDERKSLAKSSHGKPPVPDGLARRIILRVPPYLGVSEGVGVTVVVGAVVGAVVVVGDVAGEVVVVGLVVGSVQLIINMIITRRMVDRMVTYSFFTPNL